MTAMQPFAPTLVEPPQDLYYVVHKGLRLANGRILVRLGQADAADPASVAAALAALRDSIAIGLCHIRVENAHVHAALETRCPGASGDAGEDHTHHEVAFEELGALAEAVERATPGELPMALRRLYARFALFLADDLAHMHGEETQIMPLLVAKFTAEERAAIRQAIMADIPFETNVLFMRCMIPALPMSERRAMLNGMRAAMPPAAFDGLITAVLGCPWMMDDLTAFDRIVH